MEIRRIPTYPICETQTRRPGEPGDPANSLAAWRAIPEGTT
jgi:hypothetical protein